MAEGHFLSTKEKSSMDITNQSLVRRYILISARWFYDFRHFLFVLMSLQILWFVAIGVMGAYQNWPMLLSLILYTLIAGAIVIFLPSRSLAKLSDLKVWLLQDEKRVFLLLCLMALAVGIPYAYFQRSWPNEKPMLTAAEMLADQGVAGIANTFSTISMLGDQHPPLVPLLNGLTINLAGDHLFALRIVSVFFLMGTLVITYLIGRELYDRKTGLLASVLFLTFPLTVRVGSAALMDIQLAFFFSLALFLSLRLLQKPSYMLAIALGVVIGIGLLTKYLMILVFGVLLSNIIFSSSFRRRKGYFAFATVVAFSLITVWLIYASQAGLLTRQFQRILSYSGIYHVVKDINLEIKSSAPTTLLNTPNPPSTDPLPDSSDTRDEFVQKRIIQLGLESLFTRLPSDLGVYYAPLLLLGGIYLFQRRMQADWFILLWIGFVFLALFLTLPAHRYFLSAFPALAILISRFFHRHPEFSKRTILLSLIFFSASMLLFVNWSRESTLFISPIP